MAKPEEKPATETSAEPTAGMSKKAKLLILVLVFRPQGLLGARVVYRA